MADDDLDDQYLVRRAVEDISLNYKLTTVNNGSQLIDLLLSKGISENVAPVSPDCILLDLNMPLLDGIQTLTMLKANATVSHIPVFVLSTSRSESDRRRSLTCGAADFYVKPTQYRELKRIIADICEKTALQKSRTELHSKTH